MALDPGPPTLRVHAVDYGDTWPLTRPKAVLRCRSPGALTATVDGREYALNGNAMAMEYPEIRPVWRDNPDTGASATPKVNLWPLMEAARELCVE